MRIIDLLFFPAIPLKNSKFMLNRIPLACAVLTLCTSAAFAQETSTPPADSSTGPAVSPLIAPSGATKAAPAETTSVEVEKKTLVAGGEEGTGFMLPGGMGYAPLDFTPGQGRFDRKPLTFSTTAQVGYDDNIYSTSGSPLQAPVKGSMLTSLSEGVDLLLAQSRFGLSMGANAGGQYYWNRDTDKLTPTGSLNTVLGYKITPRAQLSGNINAMYTTQPTQSVVSGLTRSEGGAYLVGSSKFDLLYNWAPRFYTDSFYSLNGTAQQSQALQTSDYINQTFGQSFRYSLTQLVTGVFEGRYSRLTYPNSPSTAPSPDSNTYFALTGCDLTLTRRFSGSFRVGATTRHFDNPDQNSSSSPYGEASMNYLLSKFSTVSWDIRYGFDDGSSNANSQTSKSLRTGASFTQVLTPKLRGNLGLNYTHVSPGAETLLLSPKQDAVDATVGGMYTISQNLSAFANYTHMRRTSPDALQGFTKNIYYLGLTYQY